MQRNGPIRKALRFLCMPCWDTQKFSARQGRFHLRKYSMKLRHEKMTDINDATHPFYNYTSGRWLYNEHLRLPERRLYFNIHELCRVVAKSVGLTDSDIILFTKIAEGGSYRIFEATFRDGLKVIARLPYPSTLPRKYGVASEVATMEFLRLHGVPVPKVFNWSSSSSNTVGSEYIIMEHVQGKELADTWYTMAFKERMAAMENIVNIERILFGVQFPSSGSLFFKDSLDAGVKSVDMPENSSVKDIGRFCIGPSTEYLWWYQRRDELPANRGPWESSEELLRAVGEREIMWLRKFGEMRYPREPLYREFYGRQKVDPEVQINHLSDYLKVAPHLVPKEEQLNVPTIRHPDLSPSNIFVSDSGDITGIIDWQHATVLPIFLQAKIPKHFQNYGDDDSENFRPPELPENFAAMTDDDKETAMEIFRRQQVHYFYIGYTSRLNKPHFHAMGKYNLVLRNKLYDTACRPWEGDNTSLKAELIRIMEHWPEIASPEDSPPVNYSPAEVEDCLDRDAKQRDADDQMQALRDSIGVNIDGWLPNEEFESAREKANLMKSSMAETADTEEERKEFTELWPFQDHEEID